MQISRPNFTTTTPQWITPIGVPTGETTDEILDKTVLNSKKFLFPKAPQGCIPFYTVTEQQIYVICIKNTSVASNTTHRSLLFDRLR